MKVPLSFSQIFFWFFGFMMPVVAGCLGIVACGPRRQDSSTSCQKPDVIVISVDTLRADFTGFGGRSPSCTPFLDEIAKQSTVFLQAITPMPRTTPGLSSLLTGLWPKHHGCREVGDPVLHGETLAELLRANGYYTAAVSANPAAGPKQGLDRGFERFVTARGLLLAYRQVLYRDGSSIPSTGISWAEATSDQAIRLVQEAPEGNPLFLWLFFFDPHFSYRPPSPWQDGLMSPAVQQLYSWIDGHPGQRNEVFTGRLSLVEKALVDCRRLYAAEISNTDFQIKRVVDALRQTGRWDDSFVVFTSDHGENFGEDGLYFEHGENLHEAALKIPLFIKIPRFRGGHRERTDTVSLVDVLPTVLAGLKMRMPSSLDGRDLFAGSEILSEHVAFAESASPLRSTTFSWITSGRADRRPCVHGERFSLCEDREHEPGIFRLFDHLEDPGLEHDISARDPDRVEELKVVFEN